MHDIRWKASAVTAWNMIMTHAGQHSGSCVTQTRALGTSLNSYSSFIHVTDHKCVCELREKDYTCWSKACACALVSALVVCTVCLWKSSPFVWAPGGRKAVSATIDQSHTKRSFQPSYSAPLAFLISNLKKKSSAIHIERHCPTCSTSVKAAQVTVYNLQVVKW